MTKDQIIYRIAERAWNDWRKEGASKSGKFTMQQDTDFWIRLFINHATSAYEEFKKIANELQAKEH